MGKIGLLFILISGHTGWLVILRTTKYFTNNHASLDWPDTRIQKVARIDPERTEFVSCKIEMHKIMNDDVDDDWVN